MGPSGPFKLSSMGSYKYTMQAFKSWEKARRKANKDARDQAYKDMGEVLTKPCAVSDFYFDTWDVSRSRVFSLESKKLNKKLTFL